MFSQVAESRYRSADPRNVNRLDHPPCAALSGERGETGASATRTYVGTFCRAVRAGVRWEDVAAAGCVRLEGVAASPMATPLKTPAQCVYVQQVKTPPEVSPGPRLYLLASCTQVVRDLCPNWGPLRLQCSSADEQ